MKREAFISPEELLRKANEAKELSSILKRIKNIQLVLRTDVSLTGAQKEFLKKVPPEKRAFYKEKFLERARKKKEKKVLLMIKALEDRIRAANLPPELKNGLLKIADQIENTKQPSPEAVEKAEKIAVTEERSKKEEDRLDKHFTTEKIAIVAAQALNKSSKAALKGIARMASQNNGR